MWSTPRAPLVFRQVTPTLNKFFQTSSAVAERKYFNLPVPKPEDRATKNEFKPLIPEKKDTTPGEVLRKREENFTPFRYVYPEFLPDPRIDWRNRIREKLERIDMLKRRSNIDIPEFYVGSILSVTVSDWNAPGKSTTFVGICTERGGCGLRAWFNLRNIVDGQGVEILYEMYNPTIQTISVLKLEKRLDENIRYLRDAPPEYSTFPFDMPKEIRNPDDPVPVNTLKIKLKPKPWSARWHLWDLKGIEDVTEHLSKFEAKRIKGFNISHMVDYSKFDLMKTYRSTIPSEEQTEIFGEVHQQLANLTQTLRSQKKKRVFARPQKQA